MACIVRLVSLGADGAEHSTDVLQIARPDDLADLASLGLTLAEGKRILAGVQQGIVAAQARVHAVRRAVPSLRGGGGAALDAFHARLPVTSQPARSLSVVEPATNPGPSRRET